MWVQMDEPPQETDENMSFLEKSQNVHKTNLKFVEVQNRSDQVVLGNEGVRFGKGQTSSDADFEKFHFNRCSSVGADKQSGQKCGFKPLAEKKGKQWISRDFAR